MNLSQQIRKLEEHLARLVLRQAKAIAFLHSLDKKDPPRAGYVIRRVLELLGDGLRPFKFPATWAYYDLRGPGHRGACEDCPRCHGRGVLDVGVGALGSLAEFVLCPCVVEVKG
jgi:hypothetical protein